MIWSIQFKRTHMNTNTSHFWPDNGFYNYNYYVVSYIRKSQISLPAATHSLPISLPYSLKKDHTGVLILFDELVL